MSSVQGKKARKDITRASDRIQKILDDTYSSQTQRVDAASGASLLGIMSQNPVVASPAQTAEFQSQFSRLESLASSADSAYESARDYSVNATARNLAPMVEMAARLYGPQAGNNAMAQYSQAIADASSKAAVMATDKRMAIEQRTQEQLASLSGQAAKMNTDALNQTTQNVNAIASSTAGTIAENQLTQANLEGQKASQDIANLTWKAQGQAATRGATMQGWTNAGIMMSSGL